MAVLSNTSIRRAIRSGALGVRPFLSKALQPASYDMRLHWKMLISPTRYEEGREIDLRTEQGKRYPIRTGRFVAVMTYEELTFPLDLAGRFGLRSEFTRQGLVAFPGIQIDPGFHGRLAISLFNAGPEPINLAYKAPMFTVEFHSLDTAARIGYTGPYQHQLDFPVDQKEFILNAHTVSLEQVEAATDHIAGLEFRLLQHETAHGQQTGPTVQDLARFQGVEPLTDITTFAGIWPEDEDVDEFLSARKRRTQTSR